MKKLLHIILLSLCISLIGYAQELQKNYINYQGVASDASGDAITNTVISIQIALKFGNVTATASYIENHSITTDANGVFSLQIGNGSLVSGAYNVADWGTEASYITVSLNGTEVGTTEMVAVPYAISSGDTQWVVNGTDIENKNTGAVKVLTDLEVMGNISTQSGAIINAFSTDGTLTGNSDTALPTEKAVKTYVDNVTSGAVMSINDLSDGKADVDGSSLFLGINAGANDDGTANGNVGVGYQAMTLNTTGFENTATGYQALTSNTTGNWNTANGYQALYLNTTGARNTANGNRALSNNTTGIRNTANGNNALTNNTSGSDNLANGYAALINNSTGDNNTANGNFALFNNTTGSFNTANGIKVLYNNVEGTRNTAIGNRALFDNTTGSFNTANGASTLSLNTTGSFNTAYGSSALYSNTTGSGNVALGYKAGYNETGSNKLYIANSDTTSPLMYGEFDNEILNINGKTTVNESTASSSVHALSGIKTHTSGNFDSYGVYGENTVTDNYGYGVYGLGGFIGVRGRAVANGTGSFYGVRGSVSGGTGTNYGVYGNAAGSGTNYGVYAAGDLAYTGSLIATSDQKLKTNINKLSDGMATIMSLKPSTYSYKKSYQKSMNVSSKPQFGFMAQDLQAVLPELVSENKHPGATKEDPEISYLGINYIGLIPILTAGIQEQQEQIDALEAKIELQNQTMASLVSRLEALENR